MEHVGMDVGLRESQLAILTEAGELLDKRIRTERNFGREELEPSHLGSVVRDAVEKHSL